MTVHSILQSQPRYYLNDLNSGGPLTIYDKKIERFVLLGAVRGSLEYCNDLEFPSLFARLEDYQILKFVRKKAFGEDILPPEGTKGKRTIPQAAPNVNFG